jgi:hypothetical protein
MAAKVEAQCSISRAGDAPGRAVPGTAALAAAVEEQDRRAIGRAGSIRRQLQTVTRHAKRFKGSHSTA